MKKINLNIIYFDKFIDGGDDFSGGYEFFKILKNSTNGIFFGVKTKEDLKYLKGQINDFKFILVAPITERDFPFLEIYYSHFSHIFIFTFDKNEIKHFVSKFINIHTIETEYTNIFLKLTNLNNEYNPQIIENYKATPLNLLSEYFYNENIRKCHQELLRKTYMEKINNISIDGLSEREFNDFLYFLDNNLETIDQENNDHIDENNNNENNINNNRNNNINDINEDNIIINVQKNNKNKKINILREENIMNSSDILHIKKKSENNEISTSNINSNIKTSKFQPKITIRINTSSFEIFGEIQKSHKENIKRYLQENNNYKKSLHLIHLYTFGKEYNFYSYINNWLMSFNYNLYKKISAITGKMINMLYHLIINNTKKSIIKENKLYRCLVIKKADIFLYKACEGDIFFYPGFTSTSIIKNKATKFLKLLNITMQNLDEKCNCLIEINYNNNGVLQEANITDISYYGYEEERLFPPFSFFKIKKVYFNDVVENKRYLSNQQKEKRFDGTLENPFKIEIDIIQRNFYLDTIIAKGLKFDYDKDKEEWKIINNEK